MTLDLTRTPAAARRTVRAIGKRRAPQIACVLAGGATRGALQAGVLRALYEQGITPDLLVGTSAGALNAAYVVSRPPTVQTTKELACVWRELRREDIFPIPRRR
jgi:NTE family protein